jgi:hypothetical protein
VAAAEELVAAEEAAAAGEGGSAAAAGEIEAAVGSRARLAELRPRADRLALLVRVKAELERCVPKHQVLHRVGVA